MTWLASEVLFCTPNFAFQQLELSRTHPFGYHNWIRFILNCAYFPNYSSGISDGMKEINHRFQITKETSKNCYLVFPKVSFISSKRRRFFYFSQKVCLGQVPLATKLNFLFLFIYLACTSLRMIFLLSISW